MTTPASIQSVPSHGVETVTLDGDQRNAIAEHVSRATFGGWSSFVSGNRSAKTVARNNAIGLAAEAAFFLWAERHQSGGFREWIAQRETRNADRYQTDGGIDCRFVSDNGETVAVDVKASRCRFMASAEAANAYHLTHAPRDKTSRGVAYVMALASQNNPEDIPKQIHFVGWLWGAELIGRTDNKDFYMSWSARGETLRRMATLAGAKCQ